MFLIKIFNVINIFSEIVCLSNYSPNILFHQHDFC